MENLKNIIEVVKGLWGKFMEVAFIDVGNAPSSLDMSTRAFNDIEIDICKRFTSDDD